MPSRQVRITELTRERRGRAEEHYLRNHAKRKPEERVKPPSWERLLRLEVKKKDIAKCLATAILEALNNK